VVSAIKIMDLLNLNFAAIQRIPKLLSASILSRRSRELR